MKSKKVHFMGLGGAGISAVAAFAKKAGYEISGCDIDQTSLFLKPLIREQIKPLSGHDPRHLEDIDILVVSPAIESLDPDNKELEVARESNLPIMIGEKFLAEYILPGKKVIAVAGVHGKSTTTAMVGKILEDAQLDPSVLVGAIVSDWDKNYRLGQGGYFVVEADEFQDKFLLYSPYISLITAVEMDHPEYFHDLNALKESFENFANKTTDYLILGKNCEVAVQNPKLIVKQLGKDFQLGRFDLKLVGDFNQANATFALEIAKLLRIPEEVARDSLKRFAGIARRFEFRGEERGVKVFDDYAHHPTAIKLTAQAAREKFPAKKIWIVYQPHMFSRTKYLEKDFVETFKNLQVDEVVLVDIFAARQENKENISSKDIVDQVGKDSVRYFGDFENTANYLVKNLQEGDILINMGAGDIYKLSGILLERLKVN